MTYQNKLRKVSEVMGKLQAATYHYWRPRLTAPFAVWQEDGEDIFSSNNSPTEVVAEGTLDYFTKQEFDPICDQIPRTLRENGIRCALLSVQHETDTGLIHYEWRWSI